MGADRQSKPTPGGGTFPPEIMDNYLRDFRQNLARAVFGLASPVTIPTGMGPSFQPLRDGLIATNAVTHGRTGITVAASRGPVRSKALPRPVAALLTQPGQGARIRGNRISGFTQGIRVAGSTRQQSNFVFLHAVEVQDNRIGLRLPWQARQRGGIWIGSTLSARINGNQIIDPAYMPLADGEGPIGLDCDGIRLWGWFGPLVEVRGNFCHGTSVGIRWVSLGNDEPSWGRPDIFIGAFADNAYSGPGLPSRPTTLP